MSRIYVNEGHAEDILQQMWKQCQRQQFCDAVVLIAGNDEIRIPAHRSVLSAASDYFDTMFTSTFDESTAKEVKLPTLDGEIFRTLVKYCYTGRVEIREDNVEKLLASSGPLFLGFVVKACGDFLAEQLHPTNCLGFAFLAEQHHCEALLKLARDYSYAHFLDLQTTDEFLHLDAKQLGQLLASDHLNVQAEEDVFRSLMAWLEHERYEREQYKGKLFKLLRMPLMDLTFLIHNVRPECTSDDCYQLYQEAMKWHSLPKLRMPNISQSRKARRFNQFLMAITIQSNKLYIQYYCPQKLKWMKWLEVLEYRECLGFVLMKDDLFIVGGISRLGVESTVICLNLTTMTLKDVSPMNNYYSDASVAVLKGSLYVVGRSYAKPNMRFVEKWDSKTNSWSIVATKIGMQRNFSTAVLNEKLYLIGGDDPAHALKSAEFYDPVENIWTFITPMNVGRVSPVVAVANGMLYVVGGDFSRTIERYDPKSNKWTLIGGLEGDIHGQKYAALNNKLLLFCSDCVKEFNPLTNEWKVNTFIPLNGFYPRDHWLWYSGELLVSKFVEN